MSDQSRRREIERARLERARAERYQREIRSGNGRPAEWARPQEYDANGFPLPQRRPSFIERVARLLNPL